MFVRINVGTNYCGEWNERVYDFPDGTTTEYIESYAGEFADENALTFGDTLDCEDDEEDGYREAFYNYDILNMTREEVWGDPRSLN